jgi:hypothetical protein
MELKQPIILAFDLRQGFAQSRGTPRTVDPNIWEKIHPDRFDAIRVRIASELRRSVESIRNPLDLSLLTCIPYDWLRAREWDRGAVLIAFAATSLGPMREATRYGLVSDDYYGCSVTYLDIVRARWKSIGFDVADDSLSTSLLYTVGGSSSLATFTDPGQLNEFGLFSDQGTANSFATANAEISPEHAPFSPLEVLISALDLGEQSI